ncbi:MAG TPA: hypothetical protein VGH73_15205 [Thermoanaerobaculia bacterium]|jgi:hypothetical protein
MNEKFLVLERNIQSDLEAINRLFEALGAPELGDSEPQESLIVTAYRLHGLYTAFENIFRNVAAAFENHLDPSSWHRDLLQRMRLDLSPIRPAVIDSAAYEKLDEMRRFRNVFRTLYGLDLDPLRLRVVLHKALELKPLYRVQIGRFLEFLRGIE